MAKTYEALKSALLRLGYVRPGSLVQRFVPCGKPSCGCMSHPEAYHGPYYQWTLKIAGKTKTVRLSAEQARLCEEWIANHRKLKDIVRRMETMSLEETDRLLTRSSRRPRLRGEIRTRS